MGYSDSKILPIKMDPSLGQTQLILLAACVCIYIQYIVYIYIIIYIYIYLIMCYYIALHPMISYHIPSIINPRHAKRGSTREAKTPAVWSLATKPPPALSPLLRTFFLPKKKSPLVEGVNLGPKKSRSQVPFRLVYQCGF